MAKIQDVLARNEELAEHVIGPASDEIDRLRQFPRKNIEALGQAGVLGLMVPEQYEGLNGGLTELVFTLWRFWRAAARLRPWLSLCITARRQ